MYFIFRYTNIIDVLCAILNHPNPDVQQHVRIGKNLLSDEYGRLPLKRIKSIQKILQPFIDNE